MYSETQQYEKAVDCSKKVLALPDYANKHLFTTTSAEYLEESTEKNFKLTEQSYKKASELKPEFVDAVIALGALYKKSKTRCQSNGVVPGVSKDPRT